MHFVARRLFNSFALSRSCSLSLPHTQSCGHFPFSHTFTVHTHHCTSMGHTASTRDAAQCHELSHFAGLLFYRGREAFLFCSFLSYVTFYVNCQATNTRTHTHIGSSGSVAGGRPHQYKRTKLFGPSLLLALSRCMFSLSSLKVKEEGCRCRCRS